jgi:hypothetical protein
MTTEYLNDQWDRLNALGRSELVLESLGGLYDGHTLAGLAAKLRISVDKAQGGKESARRYGQMRRAVLKLIDADKAHSLYTGRFRSLREDHMEHYTVQFEAKRKVMDRAQDDAEWCREKLDLIVIEGKRYALNAADFTRLVTLARAAYSHGGGE